LIASGNSIEPGRRAFGTFDMRDWLESHKPAGSVGMHLLLAAAMWSVVGATLLVFGVLWELEGQHRFALLLVGGAVIVGLIKARFALDQAAARIIERIRARGDGKCIGGFLSVQTWGLVAIMAGAGRILRGGLIPTIVVGFAYAAVGTALVAAARRFWQAWWRLRARP
jgi:hypothetical protein